MGFLAASVWAQSQPNFLIIQCDDLGYDDVSLHGNQYVQTPNLESLAEESVEFSNFYVHPLCAPTRAATLTGRHYLKAGVWGVHGGRDYVNLDETMFSQVLKDAGYTTGVFGKWHSGKTDGYLPWHRGFDIAYLAHLYHYQDNNMSFNGQSHQTSGFVTARLTELAMAFIEANKDRPFLCYLPYLSIHTPLFQNGTPNAPQEFLDLYAGLKTPSGLDITAEFQTLMAMVSHMDYQVGRLLDKLDDLGLSGNTFVMFLSDNGPISAGISDEEWEMRNPNGLAGCKTRIWENGIKSTCLIRVGTRFAPRTIDIPAHVVDLFPTLCEFAGTPVPADNKPLDGRSLAPLLQDSNADWPERDLFLCEHITRDRNYDDWRNGLEYGHTPDKASMRAEDQVPGIRSGKYKISKGWAPENPFQLFDISVDPQESNDLQESLPDKYAELVGKIRAWFDELKASPDSYTPTRWVVGYNGESSTSFQPTGSRETGGGAECGARFMRYFAGPGDYAVWDIRVATTGNYDIILNFSTQGLDGTRVALTLGGQRSIAAITSSSVTGSGGNTRQSFGVFALDQGNTFLRIEVLEAGSSPGQMIFEELTWVIAERTTSAPTAEELPAVLELTAKHQRVAAGGTVDVTAVVNSPAGGTLPADDVSWELTQGGTLSAASGETVTFNSDGTPGICILTASRAGSLDAEATIDVFDPATNAWFETPRAEHWAVFNEWSDQGSGSGVSNENGALKVTHRANGLAELWLVDTVNALQFTQGQEYTVVFEYLEGSLQPVGSLELALVSAWPYNGPTVVQSTVVPDGYSTDEYTGKSVTLTAENTGTYHLAIKRMWARGPASETVDYLKNLFVAGAPNTVSVLPVAAAQAQALRLLTLPGRTNRIRWATAAQHQIDIISVGGRTVKAFSGKGPATYTWQSPHAGGVYLLRASIPGQRQLLKRFVVVR